MIDAVQIQMNPTAQLIVQAVLGLVMFGVALGLKVADFQQIAKSPRPVLLGAIAQLILFPACTAGLIWGLIWAGVGLSQSVMLGMLLLAACPGGNISNFLTQLAGGNVALSVSLSAISTVLAVVATPLNFALWAGLVLPETQAVGASIELNFWDIFGSVFILLGLPTILGMLIRHKLPDFADRIEPRVQKFSMFVFAALLILGFAANWENFILYVPAIAGVVMLHNGMGLALGYWWAKAWQLPKKDAQTISIEVGIQNSGLGLVLCLQFFPTLGGMALICAWWSIWHILSGLGLALWYKRT